MKKYYLFLIIIVLLSCCDKKKYYNIPQEDYFAFKLGDTLFYKSNVNKTDTLYISYLSSEYYESDKISYFQYLSIGVNGVGKLYSINNGYLIGLGSFQINWLKIWLHIYSDSIQPIDYNLNNLTVQRVYVVNNIDQTENPDITAIYFCMKYGVIRYDKKDGEYYELVMK